MASSAAPNAANVNEETNTVKRTAAAALGPADPAPPDKRRRLTSFASPPPSSSVKAASSRRAVRGTRTPTRTTSSVIAASWASSRSAGKAATPVVRGTPRTAISNSKNLEAKSRQLRDGRISSLSKIKKEATEGRDAAATVAASVLQKASIFDSVIRDTRKFSEICNNSAEVSSPLPTVDRFLGVYEDTMQWKNIAKSVASVELSSAKYYVSGGPHVVHELSLPNAPKAKSTMKERSTELAKDLCGQMQRWFLAFVEDALRVDDKWKHSNDTPTLVSQLNKISNWLKLVEHQITEEEEEWTMKMIKLLKPRIGHNLRRLEAGIVPPRTRSRQSHQ